MSTRFLFKPSFNPSGKKHKKLLPPAKKKHKNSAAHWSRVTGANLTISQTGWLVHPINPIIRIVQLRAKKFQPGKKHLHQATHNHVHWNSPWYERRHMVCTSVNLDSMGSDLTWTDPTYVQCLGFLFTPVENTVYVMKWDPLLGVSNNTHVGEFWWTSHIRIHCLGW